MLLSVAPFPPKVVPLREVTGGQLGKSWSLPAVTYDMSKHSTSLLETIFGLCDFAYAPTYIFNRYKIEVGFCPKFTSFFTSVFFKFLRTNMFLFFLDLTRFATEKPVRC